VLGASILGELFQVSDHLLSIWARVAPCALVGLGVIGAHEEHHVLLVQIAANNDMLCSHGGPLWAKGERRRRENLFRYTLAHAGGNSLNRKIIDKRTTW